MHLSTDKRHTLQSGVGLVVWGCEVHQQTAAVTMGCHPLVLCLGHQDKLLGATHWSAVDRAANDDRAPMMGGHTGPSHLHGHIACWTTKGLQHL